LQKTKLRPILFLTQENVDAGVMIPWKSLLSDKKGRIHGYDELTGANYLGIWQENSTEDWAAIRAEGLEL
jgi:hypothetical protein